MSGGKYRHRIALQSPTTATNDDGQKIPTGWSDPVTIWANVELAGAAESIEHRQSRGSWNATVEVRFSTLTATIRENWRFTFNGNTYEIKTARDREGTRERIVIEAETRPGIS